MVSEGTEFAILFAVPLAIAIAALVMAGPWPTPDLGLSRDRRRLWGARVAAGLLLTMFALVIGGVQNASYYSRFRLPSVDVLQLCGLFLMAMLIVLLVEHLRRRPRA